MATNFVQRGDVLTIVTPSGGLVSGQGVQIGEMFGVAQITAAEGDPCPIAMSGVVNLPKDTSTAFAQGDRVYWDGTKLDDVVTAQLCVGYAAEAVLAAATTVAVLLQPGAPTGDAPA